MVFDVTNPKFNPDLPDEKVQEIIDLYRKDIYIPEKKLGKQFLLCPVGLIGAGKTTVVKPLSEKLRLVRVSTDEIRKILKEQGYNYDKVKQIASVLTKDFLEQGYSITIDANCGSEEAMSAVKDLVKKYGLETIWVHINPPEEFIIHKLQTFKHTWLVKNGDEAVRAYYEYKKTHDHTHSDILFLYTFDTSKDDLSKQIDEAAKIIENRVHEAYKG